MGTISVPAQYAGLVEQASASTGTPAPLLAAILYNESRFQPDVVSSAGAEGIAQFMPATAAANGVDPFDPSSAIPGAADLLAQFHAAFGSWTDAVAAYAAGGGAVEAAGGVPQDGSTPAYVAKTLAEAGMAAGHDKDRHPRRLVAVPRRTRRPRHRRHRRPSRPGTTKRVAPCFAHVLDERRPRQTPRTPTGQRTPTSANRHDHKVTSGRRSNPGPRPHCRWPPNCSVRPPPRRPRSASAASSVCRSGHSTPC